jgi:hypothetical protein
MVKVTQKIQFPIILLVGDSDLSKNLVPATSGSCNNMPRKATPVRHLKLVATDADEIQFEAVHAPMMLCVGIPTANSCRKADIVNTTIAENLYEYPLPIRGWKTCRLK